MKQKVFLFLSFVLISLSLYAQDGLRKRISEVQHPDGIWYIGGKADSLGSLMAISILDASPYETERNAALKGKSACLLAKTETSSLLEALYSACAQYPVAWDELSPFYNQDTGSWCWEINSQPDILASIIASMVMTCYPAPPDNIRTNTLKYIASSSKDGINWELCGIGNTRLSLLAITTLTGYSPALSLNWKRKATGFITGLDADSLDNMELALAIRALCALSQWEPALLLRNKLLLNGNGNNEWGEAKGLPFDLLTSCFVYHALNCFSICSTDTNTDLDIPPMSAKTDTSNNKCSISALVFNIGGSISQPYDIEIKAIDDLGASTIISSTPMQPLLNGRSTLFSCETSLPVDTASILITADPNGTTADTNRENNYILIPVNSNSSRYIILDEIFASGCKSDIPLFLGPGLGTILSASISYSGFNAQSSISYSWFDNGRILEDGIIDIEGDGVRQLSTEFYPSEGQHSIELVVSDGVTQYSTTSTFTVAYNAAILRIYKTDTLTQASASEFFARESIDFHAISSYQDCDIELNIYDNKGKIIDKAAMDMEKEGHFQWHTSNHTPGTYCAAAEFFKKNTSISLAAADIEFQILPTSLNSNLALTSPSKKTTLRQGEKWQPPIAAQWESCTNVPSKVNISWQITDSTSRVMAESSKEQILDIDTSSLMQFITCKEAVSYTFNESGSFRFRLILSDGNGTLETETEIEVAPKPELILENRVSPSTIGIEPAVVTTTIQLSMENSMSSGLPLSFEVQNAPVSIKDKEDASIDIRITNIRDEAEHTVHEGVIACIVSYGKLVADIDLAPGRTEGSAVLAAISEGNASIVFSPAGGALLDNEQAILPVYVYQYDNENKQLLKKIGAFEILLHNK